MPMIAIPKREWDHHPAGQFEGFFFDVEEEREFETQWGLKKKIPLKIESSTSFRDDGQPYIITIWATKSSHPASNLRKFREKILGRELTQDELEQFDTHKEFVPVRIGYIVAHQPKSDNSGDISSFVETFWRLEDQGETPVSQQNRFQDPTPTASIPVNKRKELDKLFGPVEDDIPDTDSVQAWINSALNLEETVGLEQAHIPKCRMKFLQVTELDKCTPEQLQEYCKQLKGLLPPDKQEEDSFENDDLPF